MSPLLWDQAMTPTSAPRKPDLDTPPARHFRFIKLNRSLHPSGAKNNLWRGVASFKMRPPMLREVARAGGEPRTSGRKGTVHTFSVNHRGATVSTGEVDRGDAKSWTAESDHLGLHPARPLVLCDPAQVTSLLWASVFRSAQRG